MGPQPFLRGGAVIGTLMGVGCFAWMHLTMPAVSPIADPVSTFATDPTGGFLYLAGTLGLAFACAMLAIVHPRPLRIPLTGAAVALVVTAIFPTNPGEGITVGGLIHRYAAGTAYGFIILAGLTSVRLGLRGRWTLWLTVLNLIGMLLMIVNTFYPDFGSSGLWRGLPQRLLLLAQAALVLVLTYTVSAARSIRAGDPPRAMRAGFK